MSREAADTARRILALREEHRTIITERMGRAAANGHRVLERLYGQPIVSVNDVQALLGTTFAGANQVVRRLADLGILHEFTGRRVTAVSDTTPTSACSRRGGNHKLLSPHGGHGHLMCLSTLDPPRRGLSRSGKPEHHREEQGNHGRPGGEDVQVELLPVAQS